MSNPTAPAPHYDDALCAKCDGTRRMHPNDYCMEFVERPTAPAERRTPPESAKLRAWKLLEANGYAYLEAGDIVEWLDEAGLFAASASETPAPSGNVLPTARLAHLLRSAQRYALRCKDRMTYAEKDAARFAAAADELDAAPAAPEARAVDFEVLAMKWGGTLTGEVQRFATWLNSHRALSAAPEARLTALFEEGRNPQDGTEYEEWFARVVATARASAVKLERKADGWWLIADAEPKGMLYVTAQDDQTVLAAFRAALAATPPQETK